MNPTNQDVFYDNDALIAEIEYKRLHSLHYNIGYKLGLEEGRSSTLQAGFDEGYKHGIKLGIKMENNGANRVELCANLLEGGTTPSYGLIKVCKQHLKIPIQVMIRPRGGDFCYDDLEFEIMKQDILVAKQIGVNGVVFGILTPLGDVDLSRCKQLLELCDGLQVTFHRAFDVSNDPFKALEDIISLDSSVLEGLPTIKQLIKVANGRIQILPGGGITIRNLDRIVAELGVNEIHMALPKSLDSVMKYRNQNVYMGTTLTTSEYSITVTDGDQVQQVVRK